MKVGCHVAQQVIVVVVDDAVVDTQKLMKLSFEISSLTAFLLFVLMKYEVEKLLNVQYLTSSLQVEIRIFICKDLRLGLGLDDGIFRASVELSKCTLILIGC